MAGQVLVHDLRRGIPAVDESVDAVYHSHLLEHIDRAHAPAFLAEVVRVLRPGGVHRVVVPDFELACRRYLEHAERCVGTSGFITDHEDHIAAIIEQMVRREASGTSQQNPLRRRVENMLLGDARRRGETHQWMYDRISLPAMLRACGFRNPTVVDEATSSIPGWRRIDLDRNGDGSEYKPGSLYVEALR